MRTSSTSPMAARIRGLRANSFAATVMLLIEFGLGMGVNLFAGLPASDRGKGFFAAFAGAVASGPVVLSVHALVGTLLLVTASVAVVRAARTGRWPLLVWAALGLLAIITAWVSGTRFVGGSDSGTSLAMALATAVALLCYATILLLYPADGPRAPTSE